MVTIREEKFADFAAREMLLDEAYGAARFTKTSERLREGRLAADGLSLVATHNGRLVGTVRLWNITAGPECSALLLGPLAVHPDHRNRGIGSALMRRAIARARLAGHGAIVLVGDAAYYSRFGFSAAADRRAVDAGPVRSRPVARARASSGRACRRARHDRRRRPARASAGPRYSGRAGRSR